MPSMMMQMQTPQDLFLYELGDIYDAEQRIVQLLPAMAKECTDQQTQSAFQQHEQETRQQIQNLEQCFQALGILPPQVTCAAIQGLKQEHDSFLKDQPSDVVLTLFDLDGASKTEYYEIASYAGLIEKAQMLGQRQCASLLQQNLQQEQAMAQRVQQLEQGLGQQAMRVGSMGQQMPGQQPMLGQQPMPGQQPTTRP